VPAPPTPKHTWVVDSGASLHICNDITLFDEYVEFAKPIGLQTAGGKGQMLGVGKVWLIGMCPTVLCLKEVGYVPQSTHNLISMGKLFDEEYCFATNNRGEMFALTDKHGQCIGAIERSLSTGLYCLKNVYEAKWTDQPPSSNPDKRRAKIVRVLKGEVKPVIVPVVVAGEAKKGKDKLTLWHRRLGHLGVDGLSRLVKEDMVSRDGLN